MGIRTGRRSSLRGNSKVAIRSEGDNFEQNYCEAECIFRLETDLPQSIELKGPIPEPLDKNPEDFHPIPLFQGKFFRRIKSIHKLEPKRESLTEVSVPVSEKYFHEGFDQEMMTFSPAARDAFLQSGGLILPPGFLPTKIDEIRLFRSFLTEKLVFVQIEVVHTIDSRHICNIHVFTRDAEIVETMTGVMLEAPRGAQYNHQRKSLSPIPLVRMGRDLRDLLPDVPNELIVMAHEEFKNIEAISELKNSEIEKIQAKVAEPRQHSALGSLIAARRAALELGKRLVGIKINPETVGLIYEKDGKPQLQITDSQTAKMFEGYDISLADWSNLSMAFIGPAPVGVDIEGVETRDAETWRGLLGDDGYSVALQIARETNESFDLAATRVWTLIEAGKKANSLKRILPKYVGPLGGPWFDFAAEVENQKMEFLCTVTNIIEKSQSIAAVSIAINLEKNKKF